MVIWTRLVVLIATSLVIAGPPAEAKSAEPEGKDKPSVILESFLPPDRSILFAGHIYQLEARTELVASRLEGIEITLSVIVNGVEFFPATLKATSGVSVRGLWTWDVFAQGMGLDVEFKITGKALGSGKSYDFAKVKRTYFIAYPCYPVICPCKPCTCTPFYRWL